MKYLLYIDYTGSHEMRTRESVAYRHMDASTIEEAISEADRVYYKEGGSNEVYLLRILKRVTHGKTEKYKATMMRRTLGWKLNDETEFPHDVYLSMNGDVMSKDSCGNYWVRGIARKAE